ncbi:hypothetical protein EDC65_2275 [Stella humosa]|uniref:Uncharacterized protein n=1 Tax=Stella humosa TaxID=94 RepID=A0A3N1MH37_9PROT|nr:hypothetical protein [Stella humosa]ROQ00476.1 hypothetical protein EDC65_2275 [Stella humosa]BBK30279.1 hypothetical protein STHU_09130 [Stella humosa]
MGKLMLVVGGIALVALMAGAREPQDVRPALAPQFAAMDARAECVGRGVAYYRAIGSYPRLSGGADAASTAYDLCQRSPLAF